MPNLPTPTSDGDLWLPAHLAAQALDVSERTLRRHIGQGRYAVRRDGRRLEVCVPAKAMAKPVGTMNDDRALDAAVRTIQSLVDALLLERKRAAILEGRVSDIEQELRQLQRRREDVAS